VRRCDRCLYRGTVYDDGYGLTCLQCGHTPLTAEELASLAEVMATPRRDDGRRYAGPKARQAKLEYDRQRNALVRKAWANRRDG
jgi:hypothetical protein